MIFLDTSETRSTSTMPEIPNAQLVDNLEELTGADLMVSPFDAPAVSEPLIRAHLSKGAQLVQVKRGRDLASSVGERLNFSLAKMQAIGAKQSQCVLLFTGIMTCDTQGQAIINKQNTGKQFMHVQSAMEGWNDRGGVVTFLHRASLIPEWCRMRSRRLKKYIGEPERISYPLAPTIQEEGFLQIVSPVKDARKTLVTLPGIGQEKANLLWGELGSFTDILIWLTYPAVETTSIPGIAQGTKDKIREYIGINDVYVLGYEVLPALVESIKKKENK